MSAVSVGQLDAPELARRCGAGALVLDLGPLRLRVRTDIQTVHASLSRVYGDFPVLPSESFADVSLSLQRGSGVRRWVRQQVRLYVDGERLFFPVPVDLAPVLLEWGLNWVIGLREHRYLLIHASVVSRNGLAAILPAKPGSGKSTLAGLLCMSGWRLLSDEFGLLRLDDGRLDPIPRPFSLKGTSIEAVRSVAPAMETTATFQHPEDGPMVLVRPPADSVAARTEPAVPRWVVFPSYQPGASISTDPMSRADAFFEIQDDTFNYFVLGGAGFDALANLVESVRCVRLTYSRTDEALAFFDALEREARQ